MINYQYQVLRYMPDQFTGEFANLGVVLFSPESNFLACKLTTRYSRFSEFFGDVNGAFLMAALRRIESEVKRYSKELNHPENTGQSETNFSGIGQLTAAILPPDDSALQFSGASYGIDVDPKIAVDDLFERIVEKYNAEEQQTKHTDQHVWRKVYKNYFDKYGITKNLKKYKVPVNNVEINFDKAWKNGVWNCFQPLAFDLKSKDAIESKVFKWSGIVHALENSGKEMNLYFLINSPTEHKELETFIRETLSVRNNGLKVGVVEEDQAEDFAKKVRTDMEASNVIEDDQEPS